MLLNAKQVEAMLTTNNKGKKAQVGYDLTVSNISMINGGILYSDKTEIDDYIPMNTVTKDGKELWRLTPGSYSITFEQGCKLDDKTTAFIRQRSSLLRMGGIVTSGVYDPGFETDLMGGVMILSDSIKIEKGARIAQIIMHENSPSELYDGQFQGNKDIK